MKTVRIILAIATASLLLAGLTASASFAQGVITSGETVTGSIAPGGASASWTFAATIGDAIVIRIGEISRPGEDGQRRCRFSGRYRGPDDQRPPAHRVIDVGDMDVWTVAASIGDRIVVRVGESVTGGLTPQLPIYAPTGGAVLDTESSVIGAEVEITAAANGNYLVVVSDFVARI